MLMRRNQFLTVTEKLFYTFICKYIYTYLCLQLRLNISIQIRQVRYPSGGFKGVCLSPCVEGNVDTHRV